VVEVNEYKHTDISYTVRKESIRPLITLQVIASPGISKPIIYVNFNPNSFKGGGREIKVPRRLRYQRVAGLLKEYSSVPLEHLAQLSIIYMYYDTSADGELSLAGHEEYESQARDLICETIIDY
jgi:hypothetical protein